MNELLGRLCTTLPLNNEAPDLIHDTTYDDQHIHGQGSEQFSKIPDYVRHCLEALCSSGIDGNMRKELAGIVRLLWCGWEVSEEDVLGLDLRRSIGQCCVSIHEPVVDGQVYRYRTKPGRFAVHNGRDVRTRHSNQNRSSSPLAEMTLKGPC